MTNPDIVSGECYRRTVHDMSRELRTAQKLVSQLVTWVFGLMASTALFAVMWFFEFWIR